MKFATEVDTNLNPIRFDDLRYLVDLLLLDMSYRLIFIETRIMKDAMRTIVIRQINQIVVNGRLR